MLLRVIAVFALLWAQTRCDVVANSVPDHFTGLAKRESPEIEGFTTTQLLQTKDAIAQACDLAKAALSNAQEGNTIFNKYFPPGTADIVSGVFNNIVGGDTSSPSTQDGCADTLEQLTIRTDFTGSQAVCTDADHFSETLGGDTDNPNIVLCPPALAHPNFDIDYSQLTPAGPPPLVCTDLPTRMTSKMQIIGGMLIHEYTHAQALTVPPLLKETADEDTSGNQFYGIVAVQGISGLPLATQIADSYNWFSLESFWSATCNKGTAGFDLAQSGDENDPFCNNEPCSEPNPTEIQDPSVHSVNQGASNVTVRRAPIPYRPELYGLPGVSPRLGV